jgi:hypothetical protein
LREENRVLSDHDLSTAAVREALDALMASLARVRHQAFKRGAILNAIFYEPDGGVIVGDNAELFMSALSRWDVPDGAENGNVNRFPGVVEAGAELIAALRDLNISKASFERAASSLDAETARDRQSKIRAVLKSQQLGRAHPLQCWRQVHVLSAFEIKTIGFSVVKSSFSSETQTYDEAIARLRRRDANDVISRIEETQRTWTQARWVKPVAAFIRANVSFREGGKLVNISPNASLPIVVEEGYWPQKVKFNLPKEKPKSKVNKVTEEVKFALPFHDTPDAYLALM